MPVLEPTFSFQILVKKESYRKTIYNNLEYSYSYGSFPSHKN